MTRIRGIAAITVLMLGTGAALADPCKLAIESNDQMQYSAQELAVPPQCKQVEVTLRNVGKLPAKVMAHDWVLARESDMPAIVNAGLAAGLLRRTEKELLRVRFRLVGLREPSRLAEEEATAHDGRMPG